MSRTYVMQNGDTLSAVADAFGVTVGELLKANKQFTQKHGRDPDLIFPGEKITIPDASCFNTGITLSKGVATCPKPAGHTIQFEGTLDQIKTFRRRLKEIRDTPSGKALLENIDNSGKQVTLKHDAASRATAGETVPGSKTPADWTNATNGTGVDTTILMDTGIPDHGSAWVFDSGGNQIEFTATQNLYHELAHAKHTTNGTLDMSDAEGQAIREENVFRQDQMTLPPGVSGPPPAAPQRHGHAGIPRP